MNLKVNMAGLQFDGANGLLPIDLGWAGGLQKFWIVGGPYDYYPGREDAFGVCVREERVPKNGYDVLLPIRDFSVPRDRDAVKEALRKTIEAALDGKPVYVGCMGGWGRTGLFLALLAKACGEKDPIGYVRTHYTPRAVETLAQMEYVDKFDMTELRQWVRRRG
jgi:hypothetical protein